MTRIVLTRAGYITNIHTKAARKNGAEQVAVTEKFAKKAVPLFREGPRQVE